MCLNCRRIWCARCPCGPWRLSRSRRYRGRSRDSEASRCPRHRSRRWPRTGATSLAMPKSMTFTRPPGRHMVFSGSRSRWTIGGRWAWAARNAEAICQAIPATSVHGSAPRCFSTSRSVWPSRYSSTITSWPSISAQCRHRTMCGSSRLARMLISLTNCRRPCGVWASSACSSLMATRRRVSCSSAS